jgi:hypothetical protein
MATPLSVKTILKPETAAVLSPLQREQIVAAGKRYDGGDFSAEERLSDEGSDAEGQEQSWKGFLEIREIVDAEGKPAYDAYLYMADSGTVFRAGTTEIVAEIIQFGLECDDPELEAALESVVADKPVMAKKTAPGKPAKKTAAKKAR